MKRDKGMLETVSTSRCSIPCHTRRPVIAISQRNLLALCTISLSEAGRTSDSIAAMVSRRYFQSASSDQDAFFGHKRAPHRNRPLAAYWLLSSALRTVHTVGAIRFEPLLQPTFPASPLLDYSSFDIRFWPWRVYHDVMRGDFD